jgi:hypothetical protein
MKKIVLILFISLKCLLAEAQIDLVRQKFYMAIEDQDVAREFLKNLSASSSIGNPVVLAYKGAAEALMAKHVFNPYSKISYLNQSKKTFEKAVAADSRNVEIRFLRFSVQHYVPGFLGYSSNLDDDKEVILKNLTQFMVVEKQLASSVVDFMIESGRCNEIEVSKLKRLKL